MFFKFKLPLVRSSVLCLAAAFAFAAGAEPASRQSCSNAGLHGSYVYTAHGVTLPALGLPAPLTGAFASSGSAEFDGQGHFTLTARSSFDGVLQGPATVTGSYAVNADCSYTSQASNGVTFRAVITGHGAELLILQTSKGTVISGVAEARREREESEDEPRACSIRHSAGSYGFIADGYAGAPTLPGAPFAPLAGVGTVNLNADGTFTMMAQRSVNGSIDPQVLPLTGRATVSDCTLTLDFDIGFYFVGTIRDRNEIFFIETDPGTALSVRARRI